MSDHPCSAQDRLWLHKTLRFMLVLLIVSFGLTACGKKPGHVDPPIGVGKSEFPQTYPDPSTDPKPEQD